MKKEIWDKQDEYLGKWLTIEFLDYTDQTEENPLGSPRHPRAKAFRKGISID